MAVLSHALHGDGVTSTFRRKEGPEYTAHYQVITDDHLDEADVVRDYVLANIADFGDVYSYGNGSDTKAVLQSITPTRDANGWYSWKVALQYSPQSATKPEENEDENGDPTEDPLQFRRQIQIDRVEITKPVEKAWYLGGYSAQRDLAIGVNNQSVPINSAYVPFSPGLERPSSLYQVTVTWNVANVIVHGKPNDVLNAAQMQIPLYFGLQWLNIAPLTCKMNVRRLTAKVTNGVYHWEESRGFLYDPDTWVQEICDRGMDAAVEQGAPDGRGGYVQADDVHWDREGVPPLRRLTDADGVPISEPVLFDGNGQPLQPDANGNLVPVFGRWRTMSLYEFRNEPIFQGLLI
jgi:hypothetical protein